MDAQVLEIYTGWFVRVFALQLYTKISSSVFMSCMSSNPRSSAGGCSYQSACCPLVCGLASHLEGNIVRGVALDLNGGLRQVVEVLCEQLCNVSCQNSALCIAGFLTSFEDFAISEKAGMDILNVVEIVIDGLRRVRLRLRRCHSRKCC